MHPGDQASLNSKKALLKIESVSDLLAIKTSTSLSESEITVFTPVRKSSEIGAGSLHLEDTASWEIYGGDTITAQPVISLSVSKQELPV